MIEMHHICKTFRVAQRNAGFGEAVRALFRKDYTLVHALQDVSFTIGDGEIVGYIGPNGAGKSSTIKVMSGILTPDSGQCVIDGLVPWKSRKEHVSRIGVVFGQRSQLWWDVPVIDSFELIRDIYRVEPEAYRRQLDELTELLDLGEILRTPARQLSGCAVKSPVPCCIAPGCCFWTSPPSGWTPYPSGQYGSLSAGSTGRRKPP